MYKKNSSAGKIPLKEMSIRSMFTLYEMLWIQK